MLLDHRLRRMHARRAGTPRAAAVVQQAPCRRRARRRAAAQSLRVGTDGRCGYHPGWCDALFMDLSRSDHVIPIIKCGGGRSFAPRPAARLASPRLRRCECEFGFSGVGTDRAVVDALLGREAFDARLRIASEIFVRYVAFAQSGDPASREAVVHADLPANQMDAEIGELSRKYSRVISEVFRGKQPPQTIKWSPNGQFEIGP